MKPLLETQARHISHMLREQQEIERMARIVKALKFLKSPEPSFIFAFGVHGNTGAAQFNVETRRDALRLYRETFEPFAVKPDSVADAFAASYPPSAVSPDLSNLSPFMFELDATGPDRMTETVRFFVRVDATLFRVEIRIKDKNCFRNRNMDGERLASVTVSGLPGLGGCDTSRVLHFCSSDFWFHLGKLVAMFEDGTADELETAFLENSQVFTIFSE